jgi:hypothetical protein
MPAAWQSQFRGILDLTPFSCICSCLQRWLQMSKKSFTGGPANG